MSYFPNASIGVTGSAFPTYATLVGGSDGTLLRALSTDVSGQLKVLVENSPSVTVTGTVTVTGSVVVSQSTPANLQATVTQVSGNWNDNIAQVGGNTVATAATGVQKVGIVGSAGGVVDAAQNAAAPANEVVAGAVFNTSNPTLAAGNATQLQADSTSALVVNSQGRKNTYRAVGYKFSILGGVSFFPFFTLQGSATKTIRIKSFRFSLYDATGAATPATIVLARYSSLTGGTPASITVSKNDTNNAAATATPSTWSVLPTGASLVANIDAFDYQLTTVSATTAPAPPPYFIEFGEIAEAQNIVLRGTSDFFGVSANTVGTTPACSIMVEWTEE